MKSASIWTDVEIRPDSEIAIPPCFDPVLGAIASGVASGAGEVCVDEGEDRRGDLTSGYGVEEACFVVVVSYEDWLE